MTSETASHYWICGTCRTANATGVTRCRACGRDRGSDDVRDMGDAEVRLARPVDAADPWQDWDRKPTHVAAPPGARMRQHRAVLVVAAVVCLVPVLLLLLGVRSVSAFAVWLAGLVVLVGLEVYWRRGHSFREDLRDIRGAGTPGAPSEPPVAGPEGQPSTGRGASLPPAQGQPGVALAAPAQPAPPQVAWRPPELRQRGLSEAARVPPAAAAPPAVGPPAAQAGHATPSPSASAVFPTVPATKGTVAPVAPATLPSAVTSRPPAVPATTGAPAAPPATPAAAPATPPVAPATPPVAPAGTPVGLPVASPASAVPVSAPGAGDARCPHCGAPIDAGWDLCPSCGHRFPLSRLGTWSTPAAARSKQVPSGR
jgi:hypothetical protein